MRKITYKYRLYPNKSQTRVLEATLEECRWFYNYCLEQRKTNWENEKKSISLYDQHRTLTQLKLERTSLQQVNAQILQNVAVRVDLAFKAFFRRIKNHENPGYPRFKGKGWYDSFSYPQANNGSCVITQDGKLKLSKVGCVKTRIHRRPIGIFKTCTIRRTPTGKWYATIVCGGEINKTLPKSEKQIGIDVGIESFATYSNGSKIGNPKFFKQEQKELARAQRKLSKKSEPNDRKKAKKVVSKIHERISNRREDFSNKLSKQIVDEFGVICIEDLNTKNMLVSGKKIRISKSIADVSWSNFFQKLSYKAESAGRKLVKVNPAYTSQDCSKCGSRQVMKLDMRKYTCTSCGLELDRDVNAARNILAIGLYSLGIKSLEAHDL